MNNAKNSQKKLRHILNSKFFDEILYLLIKINFFDLRNLDTILVLHKKWTYFGYSGED